MSDKFIVAISVRVEGKTPEILKYQKDSKLFAALIVKHVLGKEEKYFDVGNREVIAVDIEAGTSDSTYQVYIEEVNGMPGEYAYHVD